MNVFLTPWDTSYNVLLDITPCPTSLSRALALGGSFTLSDPGGTHFTFTVLHQHYNFSYNFNLTFRRRSLIVGLCPPLDSIAAASRVDAASKAAYSAGAMAAGRHYGLWWLVTSTKGTWQPSGEESGCSTVFFFFYWLIQETTSIICCSYGLNSRGRPILLAATPFQLITDYTRVIERHSSPIRHTFTSLFFCFQETAGRSSATVCLFFSSHREN